jgi:hypothetical protein
MDQIVKQVARARRRLAVVATNFNTAMERTRERYTHKLTRLATDVARAEAELAEAIEAAPEQFARPKTRTRYGIKFGLRKEKGRIEIPDEAATLRLIERHCPERVDDLIVTTRRVSKDALARCDAALLKRLGVRVTADTDAPVIKAEDTEADKIIRAAMKAVNTQEV